MLNNGRVGIAFRDGTSVLLTVLGVTFFYADAQGQQSQYTIYDFPPELAKKKAYLDHFLFSIKQAKIWKRREFFEQCELKQPLVFVKKAQIEGVVCKFVLSNSLMQFIFHDKSELHIVRELKRIVFCSSKRKKRRFDSVNEILHLGSTDDIKKKLLYLKRKFNF